MDFMEKSFASASETSKLLITLSTGLIAFCAVVVNIKPTETTLFSPATDWEKGLFAAAWILFFVSVGGGIWAQLAITHVLSQGSENKPKSVWSKKITFPFQGQIVTFLLGVLLLTIYGIIRLTVQ